MEKRFIPISAPVFAGNEKAYATDCLDSTWISSQGKYIQRFEEAFADFCGVEHAAACCNGTAALHLALLALGVTRGDEVIVPTLTFVASANAVAYCGARPVFVDSEPATWNMDPALVEARITPRTKGIMVVHLYGHPVDMDPVIEIARRRGLFVLEDAAEAHGAEYKGRKVGSIGDAAAFSFFGNKIVTTGEGGMVVTNDSQLADKVRLLKGQGMDPERRYWFPVIGYNYRMTNVEAAIGLAQLEEISWQLERRREVAGWYFERLRGISSLTLPVEKEWARSIFWLFSVVLDDKIGSTRDAVIAGLLAHGIETRPVFYPMHALPPYRRSARGQRFPVADRISSRGLSLPTWAGLKEEDVDYVCRCLKEQIKS